MDNEIKVTYLNHSGVSVAFLNKLLVFDYYQKGIDQKQLKAYEEIYVFVSHRHKDHFDNEILKWNQFHENIFYVFSDDIKGDFSLKNLTFMHENENRKINDLSVTALRSTDEGVAYLVVTDTITVFHAGDLNWWHWEGEEESVNLMMGRQFCSEIDKLRNQTVNIAFIPVDPRLETASFMAIDYLMRNVDVKKVCPIHFFDDFCFIGKIREELSLREYYDKIDFYEGERR